MSKIEFEAALIPDCWEPEGTYELIVKGAPAIRRGQYHVTLESVEPPAEHYPMCSDQPAQIDCRHADCTWNRIGGNCVNVSPAITLNDDGTSKCWSRKDKEAELLPCPFCGGGAANLAVLYVPEIHVWCKKCGAQSEGFATEREAIAAWNKRTP